MKFQTYLPGSRLKPYIRHFIISENDDAQTYKVLPDTALVMGFQYAGRLAFVQNEKEMPLATAGITGLIDGYRIFKNVAQTCTLLVVFNETGAASFLKRPLHELFSQSISLDHFFSRDKLEEIEEKLFEATDDHQRINVIEQLLVDHLYENGQDKMITQAVNLINTSKGTIRITDLARELNTSQSPLEKRFRKVVGASPKKYSSIVRIKNVMVCLNQHNYQEAVYLAGYYDQAHLIKDFKTFTGSTPEQFIKEQARSNHQ